MADERETEEEPSIEEILDSIRQIISDDDDDAEEVAAEPEFVPEPEPEPEVLAEPDFEPEPMPEPVAEPAPKPAAVRAPDPEPDFEIDMVEEDEPEEVVELTDPIDEPLPKTGVLSSSARNAAYDGFSELARKTAVQTGGITLEDIVRTELNPLLREWLDKNLPNIIDRLVREELERIAKRAEIDSDGF